MWTGRPRTAASWVYPMEEAGRVVGQVEVERLRYRGALAVGSERLVVERPGVLLGPVVLRRGAQVLVCLALWTWKRNPRSFGGIR